MRRVFVAGEVLPYYDEFEVTFASDLAHNYLSSSFFEYAVGKWIRENITRNFWMSVPARSVIFENRADASLCFLAFAGGLELSDPLR